MSAPYTSEEIWTKIRALDDQIATLQGRVLSYQIGQKTVREERKLEQLIKYRAQLMAMAGEAASTSVAERAIVTDIEWDAFGNQLGQEGDGND